MHEGPHEGTKYVTKEGEKGQKNTGISCITRGYLKKGYQSVIGFEGRNVGDFFLLNFSAFLYYPTFLQ